MSMLGELLTTQIKEAQGRAGVPIKRKLKAGLHIIVIANMSGIVLEISRDRQYPSAAEWRTILNYLPFPNSKPEPTQGTDTDGRMSLKAEVKRIQGSLL
jgi:hypothetical protein